LVKTYFDVGVSDVLNTYRLIGLDCMVRVWCSNCCCRMDTIGTGLKYKCNLTNKVFFRILSVMSKKYIDGNEVPTVSKTNTRT